VIRNLKFAVADPTLFVPVITYVVAVMVSVGVPVIKPVVVLKVRPEGSNPVSEKLAIVPPVDVMV
jgi:hypothetical protein